MDRNSIVLASFRAYTVALRKESVDRNVKKRIQLQRVLWSLSARRAWIEILLVLVFGIPTSVALRKESVDRNILKTSGPSICQVALRKESVDRNFRYARRHLQVVGRSPQGERG